MDDQKEIKGNKYKDRIVSGKAISVEADKKLKSLRQKINNGSFKPAYYEWEIISKAIMEFPNHLIEDLRAERISGKDTIMLEVEEIYQDYLNSGGKLDFNSFLKKEVAPMLGKKRKQTKPVKSKVPQVQENQKLKQGGQSDKVS